MTSPLNRLAERVERITYPPELLPWPEGDGAEVIVDGVVVFENDGRAARWH